MDELKKERLVLAISTITGVACIIQDLIYGWEFWVPAVLIAAMVLLWVFHFMGHPDQNVRIGMCFAFSAFLVFFYGIHETSLYEISVSIALFMITFMIFNSMAMINMILAEFVVLMVIQIAFLITNNGIFSTSVRMKIGFHICMIITMYIFIRISIAKSIEEKKKVDEWLNASQKSDHDTEDFLSNISHELRTPVNVINGMVTLRKNSDSSDELTSIQKAGIRLANQIEDIQDYTEIKRDDSFLEEENYMCVSLVNDIISDYNTIENKNNLELVVDLDPKLPSILKGDIRKLQKILRHLIGNAVKYTKRGAILLKLFSVGQEYGLNLIIEVTDTGVGMTRAGMSQLSNGLYQANKKRDRSTGGIGIGLPIVYGFVHKMGGFVNINSTKGVGTTVRICIPQQIVDPAPCLAVSAKAGESLVYYNKPEKYKVPEVRDFYKSMVINLASGLKMNLYSIREIKKLEQLEEQIGSATILTGEAEYKDDKEAIDRLAQKGSRVIVSTKADLRAEQTGNVFFVPKPLYAFPVVRVINGGEIQEKYEVEFKGKMTLPGVKALIVDDEPMNLVVATGLLHEYDMIPDTAESGQEAIDKFEKGSYDIIFMDHMMPEMDGVEAMKRIKRIAVSEYRKTVIVALTANVLSGARQMFMSEGFDGYIAKPIDIREFERVMRNTLPGEMIKYERDA